MKLLRRRSDCCCCRCCRCVRVCVWDTACWSGEILIQPSPIHTSRLTSSSDRAIIKARPVHWHWRRLTEESSAASVRPQPESRPPDYTGSNIKLCEPERVSVRVWVGKRDKSFKKNNKWNIYTCKIAFIMIEFNRLWKHMFHIHAVLWLVSHAMVLVILTAGRDISGYYMGSGSSEFVEM